MHDWRAKDQVLESLIAHKAVYSEQLRDIRLQSMQKIPTPWSDSLDNFRLIMANLALTVQKSSLIFNIRDSTSEADIHVYDCK